MSGGDGGTGAVVSLAERADVSTTKFYQFSSRTLCYVCVNTRLRWVSSSIESSVAFKHFLPRVAQENFRGPSSISDYERSQHSSRHRSRDSVGWPGLSWHRPAPNLVVSLAGACSPWCSSRSRRASAAARASARLQCVAARRAHEWNYFTRGIAVPLPRAMLS